MAGGGPCYSVTRSHPPPAPGASEAWKAWWVFAPFPTQVEPLRFSKRFSCDVRAIPCVISGVFHAIRGAFSRVCHEISLNSPTRARHRISAASSICHRRSLEGGISPQNFCGAWRFPLNSVKKRRFPQNSVAASDSHRNPVEKRCSPQKFCGANAPPQKLRGTTAMKTDVANHENRGRVKHFSPLSNGKRRPPALENPRAAIPADYRCRV